MSRTNDLVRLHAERSPSAVALVANGRAVVYERFARDIDRFVAALGRFGLEPGRGAAVACEDVYVHLLILLAFERLGVVTASFRAGEAPEAADRIAGIDLILWDGDPPAGRARRCGLTPEWLARAFEEDGCGPDRDPPASPEDMVRILRTSGTTGGAKTMVLRRRMQEARIAQRIDNLRLEPSSRYVMSMHLTVHSVYAVAYACLWLGAMVVFDDRLPLAQTLVACAATHVTLLPVHLSAMLDDLPDGHRPTGRLTIWSIGAPLSAALRSRAERLLGARVLDSYGANEIGTICVIGPDGAGEVVDGVEMQIVNEGGAPVPYGEPGAVRVRGAGLIDEYLDNPQADREMFRNGWFHPGDRGIMPSGRRLRLHGRASDVLNVGGLKTPCPDIEAAIVDQTAAADAAVVTRPDPVAGTDAACVIFTLAAGGDAAEAEAAIRALLPEGLASVELRHVGVVPRNAIGKIDRERVRLMFERP